MNGAHVSAGTAGSGSTDIAVVVVNFGSTRLLEQNLVELTGAATIIVVDNWSSRQERAAVSAACARHGWSLVTSATNAGFGGGCNLGAAQAISLGADVLVFVNPDAHLSARGLARLADVARAQPDALVAPVIETPDGRPWSPGLMVVDLHDGATLSLRRFRLAGRRDPAGEHGHETWLSGACLAITVDLWGRVGGFDEDYFLYWEDVDLSHRVLAAGGQLGRRPRGHRGARRRQHAREPPLGDPRQVGDLLLLLDQEPTPLRGQAPR